MQMRHECEKGEKSLDYWLLPEFLRTIKGQCRGAVQLLMHRVLRLQRHEERMNIRMDKYVQFYKMYVSI